MILPTSRLLASALLLAPALLPAEEAKGEHWDDPKGSCACVLPRGWSFQERTDEAAVFRKDADAEPRPTLRLAPGPAAKNLDAYAKAREEKLGLKPPAKPSPLKLKKGEALRVDGPEKDTTRLLAFLKLGDACFDLEVTGPAASHDALAKDLEAFLQGMEPPNPKKGEHWTQPSGNFSCVLPKGWIFQEESGHKAIFREEGKTPPAFLNVDVYRAQEAKDLDAFVKAQLALLTVPGKDAAPCKFQGCDSVRASGPVGASGGGLLDLLVFVKAKEHYYAVMLTCLPKDRAAYEPVFEAFLKGLDLKDAGKK